MREKILVCTDLDRTLIANGPEPESIGARARFDALVANVGTTIYEVGAHNRWRRFGDWEADIARDWSEKSRQDLMELLHGIPKLQPQERSRQNRLKLSYYLPIKMDRPEMANRIEKRLESAGIDARLIWSIDDPAGVGLLDILPARASKLHALEYLMQARGFDLSNTLFCGDSGNDLEVLISPIPSVLVANASPEIKRQARELAELNGHGSDLYIATGGLFGMNGHYSAGILEGIAHYHPHTLEWMTLPDSPQPGSVTERSE